MTPEGKVKAAIIKILKEYNVYYFMPVQMGRGAAGVDFHCAVRVGTVALAFFIETKAPGKEPTKRQWNFQADRADQQNAHVFIIQDEGDIRRLELWLYGLKNCKCDLRRNAST